jgi:hypothetical protein
MTQADACALCESGYMSVREYLRLCEQNGWKAERR